jgi:cephalosporin hydroxylase
VKNFKQHNYQTIENMSKDQNLSELTQKWYLKASEHEYSYHFSWLGVPIIQFPQDICAMQEIIHQVQPDLIIETGIARGGSLIFYASMLALLNNPSSRVLGIDIDIRPHAHSAINDHALKKYIIMLEGSSIDKQIIQQVFEISKDFSRPLLVLDSNHTEEHVTSELLAYSPLIKPGSYIVVFDTSIAVSPNSFFVDKPWNNKNSPMQAVHKFLSANQRFQIDKTIEDKLLITECPNGYLKCTK